MSGMNKNDVSAPGVAVIFRNTPYKANNIGKGNNAGKHPPNILTLFSL